MKSHPVLLVCNKCGKDIHLTQAVYEEVVNSIRLGKPMHMDCAFSKDTVVKATLSVPHDNS